MREFVFIDSLDEDAQGEHYRTGEDFDAVLNAFSFPPPEAKTDKVDVPGADGTLDVSTALTDGVMRYNDREGEIKLILVGVDWRKQLDRLTNALHGKKLYFCPPDDEWWYYGYIRVKGNPGINYCEVSLSCNCEPWRYSKDMNITVFELGAAAVTKKLRNHGRRVAIPNITIEAGITVSITDGSSTLTGLTGGKEYKLVEYPISEKGITLTLTGSASGTAVISFREAIL
ncbi:MAG: hypothetical protein IJH37_12985 [Clostridia bacterium]|nr:hypothetical protein [Clostridia bacterium]